MLPKKFFKSKQKHILERQVHQEFGLPPTEEIVDHYNCVKGKHLNGFMYLTTSYICFDTALMGNHKLVLPLKDIKSMKKLAKHGSIHNLLNITIADGSVYQFRSFTKLQKAFVDIANQASKFGVQIDIEDTAMESGLGLARSTKIMGYDGSTKRRHKKDIKEADKEGKKLEEALQSFNLPQTERLIKKQKCHYVHSHVPHQGILYIFTRYVCFSSMMAHIKKIWAYHNIISVDKKNTAMLVPNAIQITVKESDKKRKHWFTLRSARDEVYELLIQQWNQNIRL